MNSFAVAARAGNPYMFAAAIALGIAVPGMVFLQRSNLYAEHYPLIDAFPFRWKASTHTLPPPKRGLFAATHERSPGDLVCGTAAR